MLYLVRSYGPMNHSILKIGFTDNVDKRTYHYVSAAPYNQLIAAREGDLILESLVHRYLYLLGFQFNKEGRSLDEWFIDDPEVLRVFHLSRKTIERLVWRNRDKIFNIKSASSPDYYLFEYLYNRNIDKFEGTPHKVVSGKLRKTHAKSIDVDFWKLYLKEKEKKSFVESEDVIDPLTQKFIDIYLSTGIFQRRMEAFCEFMDNQENQSAKEYILKKVDHRLIDYYSLFGTSGCRSVCYRENLLSEKMKEYNLRGTIGKKVIEIFEVGKRYSRKYIKATLKDILSSFGLSRTPKATELEKWLDIKPAFIMLEDGKKDHGFEILGIKPLQNLICE